MALMLFSYVVIDVIMVYISVYEKFKAEEEL